MTPLLEGPAIQVEAVERWVVDHPTSVFHGRAVTEYQQQVIVVFDDGSTRRMDRTWLRPIDPRT